MNEFAPLKKQIDKAIARGYKLEDIAKCLPDLKLRTITRWYNECNFPNFRSAVAILRVCDVSEDQLEYAIRSVSEWANFRIPPPEIIKECEISDEELAAIGCEYIRAFKSLAGGIDKVEYKQRFGEDGMEFIKKIRKSKRFSETETKYSLQMIDLYTPLQRARFLSALALEHQERMEQGCKETGVSLLGNEVMRAKTFDHLRQTYIRPLWANVMETCRADQSKPFEKDEKLVKVNFAMFFDLLAEGDILSLGVANESEENQ